MKMEKRRGKRGNDVKGKDENMDDEVDWNMCSSEIYIIVFKNVKKFSCQYDMGFDINFECLKLVPSKKVLGVGT